MWPLKLSCWLNKPRHTRTFVSVILDGKYWSVCVCLFVCTFRPYSHLRTFRRRRPSRASQWIAAGRSKGRLITTNDQPCMQTVCFQHQSFAGNCCLSTCKWLRLAAEVVILPSMGLLPTAILQEPPMGLMHLINNKCEWRPKALMSKLFKSDHFKYGGVLVDWIHLWLLVCLVYNTEIPRSYFLTLVYLEMLGGPG